MPKFGEAPKLEELPELPEEDVEMISEVRPVQHEGPVDLTAEAVPEEAEELTDVEWEREPGELQESDAVEAFDIHGFQGLEVAATLEKKEERKGDPNNKNEDNIIADPKTGLIGVLDGLGGEGKGDLASKSAEQVIPEAYERNIAALPKDLATIQQRLVEQQLKKANPGTPEQATQLRAQLTEMVETMLGKDPAMGRKALALVEAIRETNMAVRETGGKTTASVGFIHRAPDGSRWAVVTSIGDSPVFKRRKNGELIQVTREDSVLNSLRSSGVLSEEMVHRMKLAPETKERIPLTREVVQAMGGGEKEYAALQARGTREIPMSYKDLKRAMTASLGATEAEPNLSVRRLDEGDELVFATDGLTDKYETASGDTDLGSIAKEFTGASVKDDLDRVRKAAKGKISSAKADDDISIVTARVV